MPDGPPRDPYPDETIAGEAVDVVESAVDAERELRSATLRRTPRITAPRVLRLAEPPPAGLRNLVPGTIVVLVARPGSRLLARTVEAGRAGDLELLDALADRAGLDFLRALLPGGLDDVPERSIDDVPSLVDVRYGRTLLARGMFPMPTTEAAEAAVLWTGGDLDDRAFTCIEHVADPGAAPLETLVLLVPPRLGDVERALLARVPAGAAELHVRGSQAVFTPLAAAIALRTAPYARRATPYVAKGAEEFAKQLGKRAADAAVVVAAWLTLRDGSVHRTLAGLPDVSDDDLVRMLASPPADTTSDLGVTLSVERLLDVREELVARHPAFRKGGDDRGG